MKAFVITAGLLIVAALSIAFSTKAFGQDGVQCGPQEDVIAFLKEQYGEEVRARGLTGSPEAPVLMELWSSPISNTWTITFSEGKGVLCMMASGTNLDLVQLPPNT